MLVEAALTGLILSGAGIYQILKEKSNNIYKSDHNNITTKTSGDMKPNHYDETYDYFMKLSLDEQHKYINDNYDLRYYSNELLYDNKQSVARQAARRADKLGKSFTNRFKVY